MITNDKEIVQEANIVDIVGDFVTLKQKGINYEACCPFHAEKTPSFKVHPDKGTFKCFGCGEGGDTAAFLMKHKGMAYPEAVKYIARRSGQQVVETEQKISKEEVDHLDALYQANEAMVGALYKQPSGTGKISFGNREWAAEAVEAFRICEHPSDRIVSDAKTEHLTETGWLREGEHGIYPFYRERIIFPILNAGGRIAGVTARRIGDGPQPKYLNSPDSPIFHKEKLLYGLFQNRADIRRANEAIIVEGSTDVITLYDHGLRTAIAGLGTSLGKYQADAIHRMATNALLLYDNDEAGANAARRAIPLLLEADVHPDVCFLPDGHDPDSFCREFGGSALQAVIDSTRQDGLLWIITDGLDIKDRRSVDTATRKAIDLLSLIQDDIKRSTYIRQLCVKDKLGTGITKELRSAVESRMSDRKRKSTTDGIEVPDELSGGKIITRDNMFRIETDGGDYAISNFIIKPVMLVIGSKYSERILEIINFKNKRTLIAINSDEMVALETFKKCVERYGNFIFWGNARDYTRVREHIYEGTAECHPITMMGQHKEGFWSWANGLSIDGQFLPVDEYGVVKYNKEHYYLPAFSKLGEDILADDAGDDFETLRLFSFNQSPASSAREWGEMMQTVHGAAAAIAIPWLLSSLFYDIVFKRFRFFPHLNLFGPPGSGKTYMATSLMSIFGKPRKPFGLAQGSDPGFFRSLSQFKNACIWFDEYSNGIDRKRADAIKNAYDGTDRIVGQKTNDNKTHAQKVTSAIIISGQDQPTFDIAMFERVISISFDVIEHTEAQLVAARALKEMEGTGAFSQVAAQVLAFRSEIEAEFGNAFEDCRHAFTAIINANWPKGIRRPKERYIYNYLIPITAFYLLADRLKLPLTLQQVMDAMLELLVEQTSNIFSEDDSSRFWDIFLYCSEHAHILTVDDDYKVQIGPNFTIKETSGKRRTVQANVGTDERILFIRLEKIFPEYQERHRRQYNRNGLNRASLLHYLRGSDAYIGSTQLVSDHGPKQYLAFRMDKLEFSLNVTNKDQAEPRYTTTDTPEELPF